MSTIYFIRHAQAGPRDNYDVLSDLGRNQAELLGEHLARQGVRLSRVYSGRMQRQRHTAEIVRSVLADRKLSPPEITTDERWNEFSLADVYRGIVRRMIADDAEFARDFEEMKEALIGDPHATRGATGRCDHAIMRAWMECRYPEYKGESWAAFRARIAECAADLSSHDHDEAIAVFTSATPIAIVTASALALAEEKLLSILGVLYNTNITTMRARNGDLRLFTLNETPHLPDSLRTFR
ncbi:MAG: histidine phosphatase family protein [Blastocatellia bacterium]|nr:histidine phosphatase family protein [Blastocatellia bacterium]